MNSEVLFERTCCILRTAARTRQYTYQVLSPDNGPGIPVLIQAKSSHSPMKYIDSIIRLMQTDILTGYLSISKNVEIYVLPDQNSEDRGRNTCVRVYYKIQCSRL